MTPVAERGMSSLQRGSATLELAVVAPVVLLVLGLVVVGARLEVASGALEQAADSGARAASLARDPAAALAAAQVAVRRNLLQQGVECGDESIDVDTSAFGRHAGQDGQVVVVVSCTLALGDDTIPGLPGSRRLEATGVSALDTYRGR